MAFVCQRFSEARAPSGQVSAPLIPGLQKEVLPSAPQLKRTQAVDFMMQRASLDLARVNESTKPSFLKYPASRYYRSYKIRDDEGRSKAAKINPDLAYLLVEQGEPRVSFSQGEMTRLEQALLSIQETQNFLFWLMGTFVPSLSVTDLSPYKESYVRSSSEYPKGNVGPSTVDGCGYCQYKGS